VNKPKPLNLAAQLTHRARGNPPNTLPHSAISNCFPGLEFDFRAIWRRIFVGIVIVENNNYVVQAEDPQYQNLVGHRLLRIDGNDVVVSTTGPLIPGRSAVTIASGGGNPVAFMEWSNSIARLLKKQGQKVKCEFTKDPTTPEVLVPTDASQLISVDLEIRRIFAPSPAAAEGTAVLSEELIQPGELSQGLCSPWQNDYRECACYYWAASRPDYINVEPAGDGASRGDNWMQRRREGEYVLDNRADSRLLNYDDLFTSWEKYLRFIVGGKDAPEEKDRKIE
jgi:hypothetical protein